MSLPAKYTRTTQCIMGAWNAANLGFKIDGGKLNVWAAFASVETSVEARNVASVEIQPNTWYHAVAVYNGLSIKLYINGELVDENTNVKGGLDTVSYIAPGQEDNPEPDKVTYNFCVGAGEYADGSAMYLMNNCKINKAALYSGVMTDEDVKNAYKVATTAVPFTDVEDGWYIDSVEYAYATGLMNGSSETTFSPSVKTSRAMIVQMLYNLEGAPEVEYSDIFEDVKKTDWCSSAVMWAYQNGITSGTGDGRFDPSSPVTREQIAVFLYRYINEFKGEEQEISGELDIFGDKDDVSPYAGFTEAVSWAVGCGIISGKNEFGVIRLAPRDMAQRCETAAIIARFHEGFVK